MDELIRRRREKALESEVRREIIELLDGGEMSIRELRTELRVDLSLSLVNYHLAVLRDAELVAAVERGYRIVR